MAMINSDRTSKAGLFYFLALLAAFVFSGAGYAKGKKPKYVGVTWDGWIPVGYIPLPSAGGSLIKQKVQYDDAGIHSAYGHDWYKTYVVVRGGWVWKENEHSPVYVGPGAGKDIDKSYTWNVSIGTKGIVKVGIPMVAGGQAEVELGGSWEESTSETDHYTCPDANFLWRFRRYQAVIGLQRIVSCKKATAWSTTAPASGWVPYSHSGFTVRSSLPFTASSRYISTIEKRPVINP